MPRIVVFSALWGGQKIGVRKKIYRTLWVQSAFLINCLEMKKDKKKKKNPWMEYIAADFIKQKCLPHYTSELMVWYICSHFLLLGAQ